VRKEQARELRAENKRIFLRILQFAKPIWGRMALGGLLAAVAVACALIGPELLGQLIQVLYDHWETHTGAVASALLPGLLALLAVYAVRALVSCLQVLVLTESVSRHFTCTLRVKMADKLSRLPIRFLDGTPVGEILQRMTGDVSKMGETIDSLVNVVTNGFLQMAAIAVVVVWKDWRLGLLALAVAPLSIWLAERLSERSGVHFQEMHRQSGRLYAVVEESYASYATTKAYNLEEYVQARHEAVNRSQQRAEAQGNFLGSIVQPVIAFINALTYALISLVGGWLVVYRGVGVGQVLTIVLLSRQIAAPLEEISSVMSNIQHIIAAARRVFALLDRDEEAPIAGQLPAVSGRVEFQDVCFAYDEGAPLLQGLRIDVAPGQKIAIVGPTGAGKTTIVNLLMRFYDVQGGRILLDGVELSEVSREDSRAQFAMVLQDTWLFKGTVAENVAYGCPGATREEIVRACREACCDRFIRTLPNGYDTVVGEDEASISGGQKQLLTIARAMLADRKLLILDEATSNVDTRTELLIQRAMDRLMQGRTAFIIAHRLSTIVNADTILVLNDGKIVEQGRHQELLARRGFYYQLYTSQYAPAS